MATLASNNPYPSILIDEGAAPSSPAAGFQRLFIDTADNHLKRKNSAGAVTDIETGGAGDVVGPAASVEKEIALFDGTTGKLLERATGTGFVKVASGVYQTPNASVDLTTEVTGDLPLANLAQGSALSLLGVTGNATADYAPIAAGSDHQVMRRSGAAVAFGAVNLAQAAAVTGVLPIANIATGTPTGAKFVRDDGVLAIPTSGGGVAVVQVVNTMVSTVATGSTQIPADNTIPQNTEGDEYMTLAITPTNAAHKLLIEAIVHLSCATAARGMIAALFQDTTANALAAAMNYATTAQGPAILTVRHYMTAGTTSATTFKIRAGTNSSGTITFNGFGGTQMFGGVCASSITITEIIP